MTTTPEVGKTYICKHSRKGTFNMKINSVDTFDDGFAHGVIVAGRAGAMLPYNERETG